MPYSSETYWKATLTSEVRTNKAVWSQGDWTDVQRRVLKWMNEWVSVWSRSKKLFDTRFETARAELLR